MKALTKEDERKALLRDRPWRCRVEDEDSRRCTRPLDHVGEHKFYFEPLA